MVVPKQCINRVNYAIARPAFSSYGCASGPVAAYENGLIVNAPLARLLDNVVFLCILLTVISRHGFLKGKPIFPWQYTAVASYGTASDGGLDSGEVISFLGRKHDFYFSLIAERTNEAAWQFRKQASRVSFTAEPERNRNEEYLFYR